MSGSCNSIDWVRPQSRAHHPSISTCLSALIICLQLCLCQSGAAQDLLANRQWAVKETAGHYDNRPQEVVFFLPGPGVVKTIEDVQPFLACGRAGWQYFVAQRRRRGASDWETGWPLEAVLAKRSCQAQVEGKPNRCEATWNLSGGAENYQMRILLFPNHYGGQRTPEQGLSISVTYTPGGLSGAGSTAAGKSQGSSTLPGSFPDVTGIWDTDIPGTVKVMLDFQRAGSGWSVRFWGRNGWEIMADLRFNPATGEITFRRPLRSLGEPDQIYVARVKGNAMSGTLDGRGAWTGTRKVATNTSRGSDSGTQEPALVNLARGKPAAQSSTAYGGTAGRAVDGNTSGDFFRGNSITHTAEDNRGGPWWQVDLGASSQIDHVMIWNRRDCCGERLADFLVFVSDVPFPSTALSSPPRDARIWSHEFTGTAGPQTRIAVGRRGRYVRVQLSGSAPLSLAEVEVFGR
jgi:hypothetical protein